MDAGGLIVEAEDSNTAWLEAGGETVHAVLDEPPASDITNPFVPYGLGTPKGVSPWEHCNWARQLGHPFSNAVPSVDSDLQVALDYETATSANDIDAFREGAAKLRSCCASKCFGQRMLILSRGAW